MAVLAAAGVAQSTSTISGRVILADEDGHPGDCLAEFNVGHALADLIDGSYEIPTRRVRHGWRFGMDTLARQDIRQQRSKQPR